MSSSNISRLKNSFTCTLSSTVLAFTDSRCTIWGLQFSFPISSIYRTTDRNQCVQTLLRGLMKVEYSYMKLHDTRLTRHKKATAGN